MVAIRDGKLATETVRSLRPAATNAKTEPPAGDGPEEAAPQAGVTHEEVLEELTVLDSAGRLDLGRKDPRFWPAAGVALDALAAVEARVAEAAEMLGVSTANLISFLQADPKLWQQTNVLRAKFGQKPLR